MKKEQIIYWLSTILVSLMMLMGAITYFSKSPQMMESLPKIGLPYYFFVLLGVAKVLGVVALIYTKFETITEWAYAGFTFTFIGAAWVHYSTNTNSLMPFFALGLLALSYKFKSVRSKI